MQFIQKNKHLLSFIVILIACAYPLIFTHGKLLIGGDVILPLNTDGILKFLFQWYSSGNGLYFALNYVPLLAVTLLMSKLDIYTVYALLLVALNILGAAGVIKSVRLLFGKEAPYLFPALFFILSPALLNTWHYSFIYYCIPLFVYFILKFVVKKHISWLDTLFVSLLLFVATTDLPNPKYLFHLLLVTILIFGFGLYLKLIDKKVILAFLPKFVVIVLLSSYIFIPLANFVFYYSPDIYHVDANQGYSDGAGLPDYKTTTADKMLQLHHDNVYLNRVDMKLYLDNSLSIVGNYIFFGLILLDLVIFGKKDSSKKHKALILALTVIYLLFSIGPNPPFGFIYTFFVRQFSVLMFLRTTSGAEFFVSFFYALLLSGAILNFKKRKLVLYAVLVCALVAASYPILIGQYFKNQNYIGNKYINTNEYGYLIPNPYQDMKKTIDAINTDSKVLSLFSNLSYTDNAWGYFGNNIYTLLFEHTLLGYKDIISDLPYHDVSHVFLDNSILSIPNIEQLDVRELELVAKNGFLELYKVPDAKVLPHFYVPKTATYFAGDIKLLDDYTKLGNWGIAHEYYVAAKKNNPDYLRFNETIVPVTRRRSVVMDNYYKWDKGWSWPNANMDPRTFLYTLTHLKEKIVMTFTNTSLEKIDLRIWLAAKRAEEINKFKIDLATTTGKDLLAEYFTFQNEVLDTFYNYSDTEDEIAYWGMVNKAINYFDKSNRLLLTAGLDEALYKQSYLDYEAFKQWASGYINSNCGYYCYDLKIMHDGDYTLLIDQSALRSVGITDIQPNLEGASIAAANIRKDKDWYTINLLDLKASRTYHFGLKFVDQPNLIETGVWKKFYSDGGDDTLNLTTQNLFPGFNIIRENGGIESKTVIWGDSLTYKNISKWLPLGSYTLSFDYAVTNGYIGLAVVEDNIDFTDLYKNKDFSYLKVADYPTHTIKRTIFNEGLQYTNRTMPADSADYCSYKEDDICFKHYEKVFSASRFSKSGQLVVYNVPDIDMSSSANIRNIKIQRHLEPSVFLKSVISDELKSTPKLAFKKINPTKYIVNVSDASMPYTLIFSEKYHAGWKAYLTESQSALKDGLVVKDYLSGSVDEIAGSNYLVDKKVFETNGLSRIAEKTHYSTNGFANAWYIDPSEAKNQMDYGLIIEFEPQKTYYYSIILSVLTFGGVVLVGAYVYIAKKFKK